MDVTLWERWQRGDRARSFPSVHPDDENSGPS